MVILNVYESKSKASKYTSRSWYPITIMNFIPHAHRIVMIIIINI